MAKKKQTSGKRTRRTFTREFKQQAVQMLLDGYSAKSVCNNLGIGNTNLRRRHTSNRAAGRTCPGRAKFKPSKLLVPKKNISVKTSGFEFEVQPGSNTIDIPLSSD